jgi:hypothetical protein
MISIYDMNDHEINLNVTVTNMNASYKEREFIGTLDFSSATGQAQPHQIVPEIDPNYIAVNFIMPEIKQAHYHDLGGSLLIKTEDAKKISLMIGDTLTIRVTKDNQK